MFANEVWSMCPIHWAAFGIAAIPASLALFGFVCIRGAAVSRRIHSMNPRRGDE